MSSASTLISFSGSTPQPAAEDVVITRLRLFDTSVWMTYHRDHAESARRAEVGLGAVLAWDLLDLLMTLPVGFPVPLRSVPRMHRRRLLRAPDGIVTVTADSVTRHVVPPVSPLLAVVTSTDWRDGLARASRFAAYCSRMTVGPAAPDDQGETLALADLYGIGVAVSDQRPARVLVEPEPLTDWQPTTAWWRFTEKIHCQAGLKAEV